MAQYHYQASSLNTIIRGTQDAIEHMDTLNTQVQSSGAAIDSFNQSDSGRKMTFTLDEWNGDFGKIRGNLQQLNEKATALLKETTSTGQDATAQTN